MKQFLCSLIVIFLIIRCTTLSENKSTISDLNNIKKDSLNNASIESLKTEKKPFFFPSWYVEASKQSSLSKNAIKNYYIEFKKLNDSLLDRIHDTVFVNAVINKDKLCLIQFKGKHEDKLINYLQLINIEDNYLVDSMSFTEGVYSVECAYLSVLTFSHKDSLDDFVLNTKFCTIKSNEGFLHPYFSREIKSSKKKYSIRNKGFIPAPRH